MRPIGHCDTLRIDLKSLRISMLCQMISTSKSSCGVKLASGPGDSDLGAVGALGVVGPVINVRVMFTEVEKDKTTSGSDG